MGRIEYGYITITVGHMWIKKNVFLEIWLCFIELISTHIGPRTFPKTLERPRCMECLGVAVFPLVVPFLPLWFVINQIQPMSVHQQRVDDVTLNTVRNLQPGWQPSRPQACSQTGRRAHSPLFSMVIRLEGQYFRQKK